jgi:predicted lipoprotein with Yx(FWY)xxD motif
VKRTYVFLLAVLLTATSVSAVAAQSPTAHTSRVAKIALRHTSLGTILVSSSGRTLYEFTKDHPNSDACAKISGCSGTWPALTTSAKPKAGPGIRSSLLSTIKLSGTKQVTYAGHPLYLYSGDSGPAETSYVGEKAFGGTWYAINSSGRTVK